MVGIDIADDKLEFAKSVGAAAVVNAAKAKDAVEAVREITGGGAHVSIDALGSPTTCYNSIACLRKRGRHVQVGLLLAEERAPHVPMDKVVANELEIVGSKGRKDRAVPLRQGFALRTLREWAPKPAITWPKATDLLTRWIRPCAPRW